MYATGQITEITDDGFFAFVTADPAVIIRQKITAVEVRFDDGRTIRAEQRRKIYATLRDISLYTGHAVEELKDIFKSEYISRTGAAWFSLSDCSVSTARDFLQMLIDFCVEWEIPTMDNPLETAPDISRYLYLCLVKKLCCVCGRKPSECHHTKAVGMGRARKEIIHLGMPVMSLCRSHHVECHRLGQRTFDERYKVFGIAADEEICRARGLKHT